MTEIIMPQVGQDIPTAVITEWLKSEGDTVEQGDVIALVESDKATFEVEAEEEGTLTDILHEEGAEVDVFAPIAYINGPGKAGKETETAPAKKSDASGAVVETGAREGQRAKSDDFPALDRPRSSPAARWLAREMNVDLAAITGTGHRGRILFADVEEAGQARKAAMPPAPISPALEDSSIPLSPMRQAIARRMTESAQTIPHFYVYADVDMTAAERWRAAFNASDGDDVTVTDLLVKASAMALRARPAFNAFVEPERVVRKGAVHVGVATSVEDGLLVPVIPEADKKTLLEISVFSRKNTRAARRGALKRDVAGTFTISSLGMYGVKGFVPLINPPQCALLAVGAIEKRVIPVPGGIGVRDMMTLTLAADHRAVDGAGAARFLNEVKFSLENIEDVAPAWTGAVREGERGKGREGERGRGRQAI